jgi:hypothetical protein
MRTPRSGLAVLALFLATPAARSAEVDGYLPAGAEWVLHVDLRRLAESPAVKKHGSERLGGALRQTLPLLDPLADLGIDPLRDLRGITLAGAGLPQHDRALVLLDGDLDPDKLGKAAERLASQEAPAWKVHGEGPARIYEVGGRDRAPLFLAFPGRGRAVLSAVRKDVEAAMSADPRKPAPVSAELRALVGKADAAGAVWLASLVPERLRKLLAGTPQTAGFADSLEAFTGGLAVDDGLSLALHAHFRESRAAAGATPVAEAGRAFAAQALRDAPGLGPLLADLCDASKVTVSGGTVTLSGRLSSGPLAQRLGK